MDRLELIRSVVDGIIAKIRNEEDRKYAYLHLYGTSQFATMLAIHYNVNTELCAIAAMLHDIALYASNCGHQDHALKSAKQAKKILLDCDCFEDQEIQLLIAVILKHSDKLQKDRDVYVEILKDADVLSHYLYNPQIPIPEHDKVRLFYLLEFIRNTSIK